MIVSTRPLIDCCPIVPAAMEGRQIVQWDKDSCADAGFLKIDLLGLGMLSAVERCGRVDRPDAGRADRPLPDPLRRPGDVRVHPERGHDRGLPDREPGADAVAAPHPTGEPPGHHDPGRDRPARGRSRAGRSIPTSSAVSACASIPSYEVPYDHPSLEPVLRRDARDDHLPGPGARGGDRVRRLHPRRGRGTAAGDEPQALRCGDPGLSRPLHRGSPARARGGRSAGRAGLRDGPGVLGLRLSQGPRRRVRPARLPVDLAAGPLLAPSSCARCSTSSRWASTRPMRSCTRPNGAGSRCWRPTSTKAKPSATWSLGTATVAFGIGLGYVRGVRASEVSELVSSRRAGGRFRNLSDLASRAGASAGSLELLAWSGACDSLARGGARAGWRRGRGSRRGGRVRRCGSLARLPLAAGRRHAAESFPAARSSRSRSICRRRPCCASSRRGTRCSPTTGRPD